MRRIEHGRKAFHNPCHTFLQPRLAQPMYVSASGTAVSRHTLGTFFFDIPLQHPIEGFTAHLTSKHE